MRNVVEHPIKLVPIITYKSVSGMGSGGKCKCMYTFIYGETIETQ